MLDGADVNLSGLAMNRAVIIVVMRLDLNRVVHSGRLFLISRLHYTLVTLNRDEPVGDLCPRTSQFNSEGSIYNF